MKPKKGIKIICTWLAGCLAALFIICAVLFGLAQTTMGKQLIATHLAKQLSSKPNIQISVGRVGGLLPFRVTIDNLVFHDRNGKWLLLQDIVMRWSPTGLFRGYLHINEVSAGAIQLERLPSRLPSKRGQPKKSDMISLTWPIAFPPILLDRLFVSRLYLGNRIVGQSAIFTINGYLRLSDSYGGIESAVDIQRTDGPKGNAAFLVRVKGQSPVIFLHGLIEEGEKGLLASIIGLNKAGPFSLTIDGKGPIQSFKGQVKAQVEGVCAFEVRLFTEMHPHLILTAEGSFRSVPSRSNPGIEALLGEKTGFWLKAGYQSKQRVSLYSLTLTTESGDFLAKGEYFLRERHLRGAFTLELKNLAPLRKLADTTLEGQLSVKGTFSGPLSKLKAELELLLQEAQFSKIHVERFQGNFEVELLEPFSSPHRAMQVRGKGYTLNPNYPALQPLLLSGFDWQIAVEVSPGGAIFVNALEVSNKNLSLSLSARLDSVEPKIFADTAIEIHNLQSIAKCWEIPISGATSFRARLEWDEDTRFLFSKIEGKLFGIQPDSTLTRLLLGPEIKYAGIVKLYDGQKLTVSNLHCFTSIAELTGETSVLLSSKTFDARWQLSYPDLAVLSELLGRTIGGELKVEGKMSGSFKAPVLTANATGRAIKIGNLHFSQMTFSLRADPFQKKTKGYLQVALTQTNQTLHGMSNYVFDGHQLTLTNFSVTVSGTRLAGDLSINVHSFLTQGFLQGTSDDLSPFSAFLGERIAGGAAFKVHFTSIDKSQDITVNVHCAEIRFRFGEMKTGRINAHLHDVFNQFRASGGGKLGALRYENLTFDVIDFSFEGGKKRMNFSGKAIGHYGEGFEVNTRGAITLSKADQRLDLAEIEGHYGAYLLRLEQPAVILGSWGGYVFEGIAFQIGSGRLEISGKLQSRALDLSIYLQDLPFDSLSFIKPLHLADAVSGQVHMRGRLEQPEVSLELSMTKILRRYQEPKDSRFVVIRTRAEVRDARFRSELSLEGVAEKPLECTLSFPLTFSFFPLTLSIPSGGDLRGYIKGEISLSHLEQFYPLEEQSIEGQVKIDFNVAGRIKTPVINGFGRIEKATFEDTRTGIIIKDLFGSLEAKDRRIFLHQAQATDGRQGTLSLRGWFDTIPKEGFPFRFTIALNKATILRLDDLTANTSGQVEFSGSITNMLLTGKLTVSDAEMRIPDQPLPEIRDIQIIEIDAPTQENRPEVTSEQEEDRRLRLDLHLVSPGRIFVRGRGLDSEWKGNVHITGNVNKPAITGILSVIRGHFYLFDKQFSLADGAITFNGDTSSDHSLNLTAEKKGTNVTARVKLAGTLSSPKIALSSKPPLPQDEILSRLLFNRNSATITPLQALQLVQAIKALSGRSNVGLFDFMDRTRRVLRVDRLSVEQSEEGKSASLSVGKYLNEGVYLELDKGLGTEGREKISVEAEITPHFTIESEVGTDAQGGIGLNWKQDY